MGRNQIEGIQAAYRSPRFTRHKPLQLTVKKKKLTGRYHQEKLEPDKYVTLHRVMSGSRRAVRREWLLPARPKKATLTQENGIGRHISGTTRAKMHPQGSFRASHIHKTRGDPKVIGAQSSLPRRRPTSEAKASLQGSFLNLRSVQQQQRDILGGE